MSVKANSIPVDGAFQDDARSWFQAQARQHGLPYLLAYADDGVIWGRWDAEKGLQLAGDAFDEVAVALRAQTLQQARLFGPEGELFLWLEGDGFAGRLIMDGEEGAENTLKDDYWLWGQSGQPEEPRDGFTMLCEGQQGLVHAPPVKVGKKERGVLRVRHYVSFDDRGQAYIAHSRLLDLDTVKEENDGDQT